MTILLSCEGVMMRIMAETPDKKILTIHKPSQKEENSNLHYESERYTSFFYLITLPPTRCALNYTVTVYSSVLHCRCIQ
jgi:hypothetical protein